jgi:hypothetical protein
LSVVSSKRVASLNKNKRYDWPYPVLHFEALAKLQNFEKILCKIYLLISLLVFVQTWQLYSDVVSTEIVARKN